MDETATISSKTWSRNLEPILKSGYMDGAADGQSSVFQSSFDTGYQQGLCFGLHLGRQDAKHSTRAQGQVKEMHRDLININCQICSNTSVPQQNVVNLFNIQKEKNEEYLHNLNKNH